jgi:hypothetical protein
MNSHQAIVGGCFLILTLALGTLNAHAQDAPQEPTETKPKPAGTSYPIPTIDPGNAQEENPNALQPDTTPLTGVQNATLGSPEMRHSYWVPGAQYTGSIQSGGYNPSNSSGWYMDNYLIGNLSLLKAWSRSQLAVNYSGGGFFSSSSTQGSGAYQQLALTQSFEWNRWNILILDQFSYLPQSAFGFGGTSNLGIPGVGGTVSPVIPGIGNNYVPNQSIYASSGPRYSNAATVQATYATSARGSITASGTYGILRFVDPGNVDNSTTIGTIGYNYVLDRESTIGVLYSFSAFHYPGEPQAFGSHVVSAAYSRKITGRLALQAYGGPQFTTFRVPVGTQSNKLGANVNVSVSYGFERGGLTATYYHGITGGSGAFTGSTVNLVSLLASRQLTRVWTGNFNVGYAHNTAAVNSTQTAFPTYSSWYVGGGVSRPLSKNMNLSVAYSANINTTSQSSCSGPSCNGSQILNYIYVNLQWHTRPLVLP